MRVEKERLKGLSTAEAEQSRSKYGANVIKEKEPPTLLEAFKDGFEDPMIKLLCGVAVMLIVFWCIAISGVIPGIDVSVFEPIGIILTVCAVSLIMAKTTLASDGAYRKLKNSIKKDQVKVYRDGVVTVVAVDDIVVGDIVILQSGDKIPADGLLVHGDVRVNNSALNGETEENKKFAVDKIVDFPENVTMDTVTDKQTMFKGSIVYDGEALMLVQKVGMETLMGKTAGSDEDDIPSPLKIKLADLAEKISKFGYTGAVVISVAYLIHYITLSGGVSAWLGHGWFFVLNNIIEALMVAVMIIVCAVPEGLPLMISLVLMQNTGVLLEHNCLVRKAIGIETAGSLNILFSDKTGTITKGQLEVVEVFGGNAKAVTGDSAIRNLMNIAICRNTSSMFDDKHNIVGGNLTDHALMAFTGEEIFSTLGKDEVYEVNKSQDFNSSNKFSQAYLGKLGKTFYKGAPEKLLAKATKCMDSDGTIIDIDKELLDRKINNLAVQAKRVLAFGYSESQLVENEINEDIVIIGFVGIRDDVRPEAKTAIEEVKGAGIQVVMITGDRLETAVAIAKEASLLEGDILVINDESDADKVLASDSKVDTVAVPSYVLNKLSDDVIKRLMPKIRVIARALPTDKSRMIKLCQELKLVAGMTGDGRRLCPVLQ